MCSLSQSVTPPSPFFPDTEAAALKASGISGASGLGIAPSSMIMPSRKASAFRRSTAPVMVGPGGATSRSLLPDPHAAYREFSVVGEAKDVAVPGEALAQPP